MGCDLSPQFHFCSRFLGLQAREVLLLRFPVASPSLPVVFHSHCAVFSLVLGSFHTQWLTEWLAGATEATKWLARLGCGGARTVLPRPVLIWPGSPSERLIHGKKKKTSNKTDEKAGEHTDKAAGRGEWRRNGAPSCPGNNT